MNINDILCSDAKRNPNYCSECGNGPRGTLDCTEARLTETAAILERLDECISEGKSHLEEPYYVGKEEVRVTLGVLFYIKHGRMITEADL